MPQLTKTPRNAASEEAVVETYASFAPFYDAVQGERGRHAGYVRALIEKHHPDAATVLELACGTGMIMRELQTRYRVVGVDLSRDMLAIAAKNVPGMRLVHGDMTQIRLAAKFDVVLCLYDSINHLLEFDQWKAVFARARAHLPGGGLFIFDMNTDQQFERLLNQPPAVRWFGPGHLFVIGLASETERIRVWKIRVFERLGGSNFRLHSEDIREVAFPLAAVRAELRRHFAKIWVYDTKRRRPSVRSERLHFVCQA